MTKPQRRQPNQRNGTAGDEHPPVSDKKLSLWPLTVEEATEAMLQVPPMPKDKEKARPKPQRSRKNAKATDTSP
jgi:hypothetical protein